MAELAYSLICWYTYKTAIQVYCAYISTEVGQATNMIAMLIAADGPYRAVWPQLFILDSCFSFLLGIAYESFHQ